MTFPEFMAAFLAGTLHTDAGWRAYDVEKWASSVARVKYIRASLKKLGLTYAGELAVPEFCARYGLDRNVAEELLACFWGFTLIDERRFHRIPLRSAGSETGVS